MNYTKIMLGGLVAFAATVNAMPTPEQTKKVEPLVMDLMREDQAALKSGKKTRAEVAESAMELADKADSEAEKLLLMKGAFNLYVRAGEFDKAIEALQSLRAAIPDIPPANIANIIETALLGVPRKEGDASLYKLLDESKKAGRRKRLEIAEGSGRENLIPEAKETVDGYTWSYRVQNGEATIISEKEGKDSCAVSPNPVGSIVIPATLGGAKVTSIGRGALAGCQELESVTIPQGVKRIGRVAFFECKKLKSVEIPSSVTEIDWCAFYRCNALASVAIPSDSELKTLENGAFAECFELKSIAIPDGVTRIARHAFLGCFNIKSLTIPATASNIGGEAFRFCANLSSVTMLGEKPDTSVPPVNRSRTSDNIFLDCGKLKSIHVPANAKSWAGMKDWFGIPLVFDAK